MNSAPRQGQRMSPSKWRQMLDLGEKILAQVQQWEDDSFPGLRDLAALYELICQTTGQLAGGQAECWFSPPFVRHFDRGREADEGVLNKLLAPSPPQESMQQAFLQRRPVWGADGRVANLPLLAGEEVLGVLWVQRQGASKFSQQEREWLESLAQQVSLALQNGLRRAAERWLLEQLSLVGQVSAQISNVRDIDELARRITALILETFKYYYVAVFTLEPGQNMLRFRGSAGPTGFAPIVSVRLGEGIIGHVAQTGQEILALDTRQEARYRHLEVLPDTLSEMALPLKIEDRLLGVLDVQSDRLDDFDETDRLVLRTLAGNIAIALEGAHLYQALQQRAAQLAVVYEVSNAITSILNQDELLRTVAELIQRRFGYPHVLLYTVHPGRRRIFYQAGSGPRSQVLQGKEFWYDLDASNGIIPWVARQGETILANDVSKEPRYVPSPFPPHTTQSELAVPLIFGGNVLGVLDVQSDQPNAFGEEDRFALEALGSNIAIALRNAALYQSEAWRRQVADSLREVAGLLSTEIDLDRVLEIILSELERTLPLDVAAIWLLEESAAEEELQPEFRLAAFHGPAVYDLDLDTGLTPAEVLRVNPSEIRELPELLASEWLLEALESDQPVVRTTDALYEPLGAVLDFPPDYSAIAAPLRAGEKRLGVLTLAHRTPYRYGSEARAMTAAFASYAAVAIQNTRLYEEAQEQAWVSTLLLQVAEATQAISNQSELLDTVTRLTPMLVGVQSCMLYLNEDETFVPVASSGLSKEQQTEFERWRFAAEDVPALQEMLLHHQPVILSAEGDDQRLAGILRVDQAESENGLQVLVPLTARGEVLGAFLVNYRPEPGLVIGSKALDTFFDERLMIMQGIAHQTAIAIENIRLLKAQKEEAYISVALLQVAQAIVSSKDLEETLGSIVRITPILVGVRRAAIFLWESEAQRFCLFQAYGLPREVSGCTFEAQDFPLLKAVQEHNTVIACPWREDLLAGSEAPEAWAELPAPPIEAVPDLLAHESSLLLAFPLAVKGEVLGAFLVEEPEALAGEAAADSGANRRVRARRMEIITGITQQAAMAIQNDRLQHEMVERERLEREMQLARQIQQTFLPETAPELPGWELQMLWRTAREVGGDFYDFFELPGRRLALVIADVADKGMPAALYMTVARTLLRAAALEAASAAEALQRVNDTLVEDTPEGMFVTLAYAVLHLESGELQIANAGHNPPLVLRSKTCQLEKITRSGMALGVEKGTPIENRTVLLDPGDMLIMYTDGVTEAFSPQGDPFGEERLIEVILQTAVCATGAEASGALEAGEVLQAIDHSVSEFVVEDELSDDLTLLIVRRKPLKDGG